jgi:hypothetical protein
VQLPDAQLTAALVKQNMQVNLGKLEEQLSKQNKRFKAVQNEYAVTVKRNANHANVQSTSSLSKKSAKEEGKETPKEPPVLSSEKENAAK